MEEKKAKPTEKPNHLKNPKVIRAGIVLLVLAAIGGGIYLYENSKRVYIEDASVYAPTIDLSSLQPGTLKDVYVQEGQTVAAQAQVARVDDTIIHSEIPGLIIKATQDVGKAVTPGQPVVSMIDPRALRIVGQIKEDKGLKDIKVGQNAVFTVDAFGSRKFEGTVEKIAPSSRESAVIFNISDKREEKEFDVTVKYDLNAYPYLKNGMSAKLWVYKQ